MATYISIARDMGLDCDGCFGEAMLGVQHYGSAFDTIPRDRIAQFKQALEDEVWNHEIGRV